MLFVVSFLVAAAIVAARDCAPVPLEAQYWQPTSLAATAAANNVEGALLLSLSATSESLLAQFATEFAEAQDLTSHSLLSFNLFKVKSPAQVVVLVSTPHGTYRTPAAALFEQANTITVDLASSEFASSADAVVFDEPIIGLSAVKSIALHFVAAEIGAAQVTVDSLLVCASPAAVVAVADVAAVDAAPLEFPDVASLSTALSTAIGEAQRLAAEVAELKNTQRRARRSFDEFAAAVHTTLDKAVEALTGAVTANVEQTLVNSKLLQRLRERIQDASAKHDERLAQLDAQFVALRSLSVKQGESLADAVHRVNADEKQGLEKRSVLVAQALAVEAAPLAAVPTVDESFGLSIKKVNRKASPVVRAP